MPYGNRHLYYRKCPICKRIFRLPFWELNSKRTCSFQCSKKYKRTLPISKEISSRISKALKGKYLKEKSSQWKGNNASYESKHEWIRKNFKIPVRCQDCGEIRKLH